MCGRYFLKLTPEKMREIFGTENPFDFPALHNACPTQKLPIIVQGKTTARAGYARWGLLPPHASYDDQTLAVKLKNARSETVLEKRSFAELWARGRRCIVPASGFYEWPEEKIKGHSGYAISSQDEAFGMAGLWNRSGELVTFTILTAQATGGLEKIHSRMPVMFDGMTAKEWLKVSTDQAYGMMLQKRLRSDFVIEERQREAPESLTGSLV